MIWSLNFKINSLHLSLIGHYGGAELSIIKFEEKSHISFHFSSHLPSHFASSHISFYLSFITISISSFITSHLISSFKKLRINYHLTYHLPSLSLLLNNSSHLLNFKLFIWRMRWKNSFWGYFLLIRKKMKWHLSFFLSFSFVDYIYL